ncbi:hypothetical protein BDZ91DRAFT_801903 [Kalaharituber pfeilii]|nr:hypothetical protein BDZ91DRAFT_801903 [Kalaharituber pfeilii]
MKIWQDADAFSTSLSPSRSAPQFLQTMMRSIPNTPAPSPARSPRQSLDGSLLVTKLGCLRMPLAQPPPTHINPSTQYCQHKSNLTISHISSPYLHEDPIVSPHVPTATVEGRPRSKWSWAKLPTAYTPIESDQCSQEKDLSASRATIDVSQPSRMREVIPPDEKTSKVIGSANNSPFALKMQTFWTNCVKTVSSFPFNKNRKFPGGFGDKEDDEYVASSKRQFLTEQNHENASSPATTSKFGGGPKPGEAIQECVAMGEWWDTDPQASEIERQNEELPDEISAEDRVNSKTPIPHTASVERKSRETLENGGGEMTKESPDSATPLRQPVETYQAVSAASDELTDKVATDAKYECSLPEGLKQKEIDCSSISTTTTHVQTTDDDDDDDDDDWVHRWLSLYSKNPANNSNKEEKPPNKYR